MQKNTTTSPNFDQLQSAYRSLTPLKVPAVRFLTRTFRNVLYVRVGKLIVCLWRSQHERSFEEARSEMEVGRRRLPPPLASEARPLLPLAPWTRPAGIQTEPKLEPATSVGVILPQTGQSLMLCSLQLWQQLQCCRQARARVPLFFDTFYFRSEETVRRK